ncbi:MAG: discoidin domain-containing protein, partial [Phycisphaerales bacterium]
MMGKMRSVTVLICVLAVSNAWGIGFKDDFDRPDGEVGNGWATQTNGTITVEIVDGEVLITGQQATDWVRCGISRPVTDETVVSCDFRAGESFNFHIRVDDRDTSAFFEIYTWGGPLIHANSVDGGWPGWTDITGSNIVAGEYNNVELELIDSEFIVRLNGTEVITLANANFTNIGSLLISSDAAAGTTGSLHIDNVRIGTVVAGTAKAPTPANGLADVPLDVVMAWTPGDFAVAHDVYFGTSVEDINAASRADGMGVLVSQGQDANTYDPDALEFGQTYYWRIDEVNAAPDNTILKGELWSFTTEPFVYPVENIIATASSADAGAGPENTVNGSGLDAAGLHSIEATDMWLTDAAGEQPAWIQYEFDGVYKLHQMSVWNYNVQFELVLGFGLKDVTVEYSTDSVEWTILGDYEFGQGTARTGYAANTVIDLDGVVAKYVRLTANRNWGGMLPQFGLSEVAFLHKPVAAREPIPADGAAGVALDVTLDWRAGREVATHDVYLSADRAAVEDGTALVDSVDESRYATSGLNLGETYYWKVNEVNEAAVPSVWEGQVWNFSTQDYLVVEDFESYNDEDNVIYETWLDGWVNDTGSTVGYLEAPFAERTIVNSGRQSMPLFYDNVGVSTSEADFELAQNWTASGVRSLSIRFHGDADSTVGQLYVTINGTKVAYDGDAADLNGAMWQSWNIDLSTVGNVSNVRSLTIGIEGAGASGVIYIDDIRLYPSAPEVIVPAEPDAANLVASYAFDGNANDASGNGHDGTVIGDITFVSDPERGQVVSLPGGDDQYISIEGVGISGNMPRTIACWAKADSTSIPDWTLIFGFTGTDDGQGGNGSHFNIGSLGGPGGVGAHCWGWEETIFSDDQAL